MKLLAIISLLGLASTVTAFLPPRQMTTRRSQLAAYASMLDDIDIMCILNTADYCTNEECSLDEITWKP
jgi:hypothetical protein